MTPKAFFLTLKDFEISMLLTWIMDGADLWNLSLLKLRVRTQENRNKTLNTDGS